ncbi:Acetylornithine deacetylase [hydrothermal vent metagenome]|uniref:Acetylornithine deacetylase n=1 Tax=hydrothermal vent metagenome TaxID=652676 RepID=A0A3B1BA57_9ZZZZ
MTTPNLIQMIQALIATPSISSVNPSWDQDNTTIIDLLAQWLAGLGMQVEIMPVPNHPGKANLIATTGSGPDGLVLAGHTDTVPYDEGRWTHDPFKLTEADDRLYGLGTADMKSFFALVIEAIRDLPLKQLKQPLTILATADEESTMSGAQALTTAQRHLGRYAIIGEPTSLRPIRMHKGIAMESIRLTGRSGHSSNPAYGINALEGMHKVIGQILTWQKTLAANYQNQMFEIPTPTINLGHIHGGDSPNRICAQCELHIDIRLLPGMELDEMRNTLEQQLHAIISGSGLKLEIEPLFHGTPAMETPANTKIVRVAEELTGHTASAVAFGTEGPYLNKLGMETIIMGPGNIAQAHQPDEYLETSHIQPAIDLIQSLVRKFCC